VFVIDSEKRSAFSVDLGRYFGSFHAAAHYLLVAQRERVSPTIIQMATIINLYLIPRGTSGSLSSGVRQVTEALIRARVVRPPVVVGPALLSTGRLVQPQEACGWADPEFEQISRKYSHLPTDLAEFGRTGDPEILAFGGLDEAHPAIRGDFVNYQGYECALGAYAVPRGFRLVLTSGDDDEAVFDRTVFAWIQLQGKAAPWPGIYHGSHLDRLIRTCWADIDVVESDWL